MPRLTTRDYKRSSRNSGVARLKDFGLGVVVGAVLASAAFMVVSARAHHHAAASARIGAGADTEGKAPHAPAPDDTSSDGPDPAPPSGAASSPQSGSARGTQAPQYDFYRMLPRFKVPVSHDDDHAAQAGPPAVAAGPERPAASGPSYVLQVGSYRSTAEADQVRARLARVGISAQVQRIVEGSSAWNRVRIGPLSDAELVRVRERLRTANIHAMTIRAN
ncbi:MAG TPA: SPOR domain-containing protein [Steroidobacteraceae bacterium]|jgi:cell division protein FtsN|nr:SPOR domain-containing protein [Steroidobacteraceae bacterium]